MYGWARRPRCRQQALAEAHASPLEAKHRTRGPQHILLIDPLHLGLAAASRRGVTARNAVTVGPLVWGAAVSDEPDLRSHPGCSGGPAPLLVSGAAPYTTAARRASAARARRAAHALVRGSAEVALWSRWREICCQSAPA